MSDGTNSAQGGGSGSGRNPARGLGHVDAGLAYDDAGHGTGLVLLHGVGLDRRMWDRCRPALAARHRTRAVDLRGHGGSSPAPGGVTLTELAHDVLGTLDGPDGLTEPAHLVGFSLGALVAARAALLRPEAVASLTLVSSVARRTEQESREVQRRLETARRDFPASVHAAVERWFTTPWKAAEPELAAAVQATLLAQDHSSYLACYEVFARADRELWPRLPEISVPTLAVTGEADPGSTPEMTRQLAGAIPGARDVVVPGARHLLPLEAPGPLTTEIIRHTTEVDRDRTTATAP
ncbi:alpha/beta fold hydrolase [Streptomyces sp. NBC_01186]|uniref:alpha/beta fold hydrolase n=1 Tax=unclassified Streptomyces TaxID=2593676 RepID=UPI002DD9E395|nr:MULTISPECIES: alpha/beta fold hydrolase [unclassified Streptomyces]WSB75125.1 alpha/beta fold hydrolase [Streptomyces sp. NBC_01775]WSS16592.1 alpha/beta fold hydrolase [Streptomyces sp. NBC_01186]